MRFKTMLAVLVMTVMAALFVVGCSPNNETSSTNKGSLSDAQTRIVVDAHGRTVKLPADVQTASTIGSATRIVVYAGAQDKLISVGEIDKTDTVEMPYSVAAADVFKDLPTTNSGSNYLLDGQIDTQKLIELNPDVIISSGSADACDALQEVTGIPVIGVFYQNQLFTENVINSIECVGEALGTESHAQQVIAKLQTWHDDINSRTAQFGTADDPLAYFGAVTYFEGHNWNGTYANYAPAIVAHVRNAANEIASDGYVEVSIEQIAEWDPDFMFINRLDYDSFKEAYDQNKAIFDNIKAFQNGNLYTIPAYNYNGTDIAAGICQSYYIGATIYPEAFEGVDLDAMYDDIYKTMLDGFDFYAYFRNAGRYYGKFPTL